MDEIVLGERTLRFRVAASGILATALLFPVLAARTVAAGRDAGAERALARDRAPLPHDVPADVVVLAFARAGEGSLTLVVRVPLASMRDVEFPVRPQGYVDVRAAAPLLAEQAELWIAGYVAAYEESERLPPPTVVGARVSLPSDPSFLGFETALDHVLNGPPIPADADLALEQAMLDVVLRTPVRSAESRFSLDPAWAHLGIRTVTVLRFVAPTGEERIYRLEGNPGRVRLDPRWHQAFLRFVALGFAHILEGADHLLFLLCLVAPLRRLRPLVSVVTAFTVAHSITLAASALGLAPRALWFPPLVETAIAASIVVMALENVLGDARERRWMWAFGFGLVHGFGFAFQLRESLQFAGRHLWTSLLGFNLGVEIGQLAALLVAAPALALLRGKLAKPRVANVALSVVVAHASWHWMARRWTELRAHDLRWPAMDAQSGATLLRWLLLALCVLAAAWAFREIDGRLGAPRRRDGQRKEPPERTPDEAGGPPGAPGNRPQPGA